MKTWQVDYVVKRPHLLTETGEQAVLTCEYSEIQQHLEALHPHETFIDPKPRQIEVLTVTEIYT